MKSKRTKVVDVFKRVWLSNIAWGRQHVVLLAAVAILMYLIAGQWSFFHSGDTWAESFTEYLDEALHKPWGEVWAPSWVGYLTLLPSFLSKAYVELGLSLGVIDYFYHTVTVLFALGCASFAASKYNRALIQSDVLRILLAVLFVLLLTDVAVFSFINIWYVGFIPLLLIALNPQRLPKIRQALYVLFGVLVCLSKPSLVLAPFFVYRAIKTKEYVSNGLLFVAAAVQTYFLLHAGKAAAIDAQSLDVTATAQALLWGAAAALHKMVHIYPGDSTVAVAVTVAVGALCTGLLFWARGLWVTLLVLFALALSVYGHVLPPGEYVFQSVQSVGELYQYTFKPQREFMIAVILLLWLFLLLPKCISFVRSKLRKRWHWVPLAAVCVLLALLGVRLYQPMNTYLLSDLGPYRSSLAARQSVCVPLPVPSTGYLDVHWVFQYSGGCAVGNGGLRANPASFTTRLSGRRPVTVTPEPGNALKSVLFVLRTGSDRPVRLTLRDVQTGIPYFATLHPAAGLVTASFNTTGVPARPVYEFTLSASSNNVYLGTFEGSSRLVMYSYSMGGARAAQ